eukprot:scaffold3058_cov65-Phaeocystis_antarctica.AAC.5
MAIVGTAIVGIATAVSRTEVGGDGDDLADGTRREQLARLAHRREAARPHALEKEEAALVRLPRERLHIGRAQRQWLLHNHVLAGRQRDPGALHVRLRHRAHVDDIHLGVGRQRLVPLVHPLDRQLARKGGRALEIASTDRHDHALLRGERLERAHEVARDQTGAHHAPTDRAVAVDDAAREEVYRNHAERVRPRRLQVRL